MLRQVAQDKEQCETLIENIRVKKQDQKYFSETTSLAAAVLPVYSIR